MNNEEKLQQIIKLIQNMTLKEALKEVCMGTKSFMQLIPLYPELKEEYDRQVRLKRGKSRPSLIKTLSDEEITLIRSEYEEGASLSGLSKKFKTSPTIIKREFKKRNLNLRTQEEINRVQGIAKCPVKTDEEWGDVYSYYKEVKNILKVVEKYGTSEVTVKNNFKRLGFCIFPKTSFPKFSTSKGLVGYEDKEFWENLYNYYLDNPIKKVEEEYGIERRRIYNIFKFYEWKKRSKKEEVDLIEYDSGLESFNSVKSYLTEYDILEPFKGYTKRGKYLKYTFRHKKCGHKFKRTLHDFESIRCYHCYPTSSYEQEIFEYVSKYVSVEKNTRRVIPPKELDLYIPSLNIAIEYNGRYWHSELVVGKKYHKEKTEECLGKGVRLYHFWEGQDFSIIRSRINQMLGRSDKVHARKTIIDFISPKERREFFKENHISGDTQACFSLCLKYHNNVVACISFRRSKGSIELARFACKKNISVVGGFTKLLNHSISVIKERYPNVKTITTYCNRDWTADYKDSVYAKNGFTFIRDTGPILSYYNSIKGTTESREKYQKHKLKKLFPEYNGEDVNEFLRGKRIYRIYNSGNWKFERKI